MPAKSPPGTKYYSITEAAALVDKGRSTLYRLMAEGKLPYRVMQNGRRRLAEQDIEDIRRLLDEPVDHIKPDPRAA